MTRKNHTGSRGLSSLLLGFVFLCWGVCVFAAVDKTAPASATAPSVEVPGAGNKVWINEEFYFIHEFDKTPALGPLVLKIKLYSKDGERSTALTFKGSSDMPSMRGAHYTGDNLFHLSKKGDYLLPINVVMPGDWEVKVFALSGDSIIFSGHILFDV